ncbi:hypothetical protein Tco_0701654 [Tanacetum coccineum]
MGRLGGHPNTTEIRQFLGLAGYYRRFIEGFSKIARPMTKLTQKSVKFAWGEKAEAAFQLLKQKLCRKKQAATSSCLVKTIRVKPPKQILSAQSEARKKKLQSTRFPCMINKLEPSAADGTLFLNNLKLFRACDLRPDYHGFAYVERSHNGKGNITMYFVTKLPRDSDWARHDLCIKAAKFEALYGRKCRSPIQLGLKVGTVSSLAQMHPRDTREIQLKEPYLSSP